MLPGPGWLLFNCFLTLEAVIVLILVMPMPSNRFRGYILDGLLGVWKKQKVRYGCWAIVSLCGFYFYDSVSMLWTAPEWAVSCEQNEVLFSTERNAYATGMSVLLFLVIRRLLEIQQQLFILRHQAKMSSSGTPLKGGKAE